MIADDAWVVDDPIPCSFVDSNGAVCGREACEDHLPLSRLRRHGPGGRETDKRADRDARPPRREKPIDSSRSRRRSMRQRVSREARRQLDAEERPPVILPPFETLRERLARPVD